MGRVGCLRTHRPRWRGLPIVIQLGLLTCTPSSSDYIRGAENPSLASHLITDLDIDLYLGTLNLGHKDLLSYTRNTIHIHPIQDVGYSDLAARTCLNHCVLRSVYHRELPRTALTDL